MNTPVALSLTHHIYGVWGILMWFCFVRTFIGYFLLIHVHNRHHIRDQGDIWGDFQYCLTPLTPHLDLLLPIPMQMQTPNIIIFRWFKTCIHTIFHIRVHILRNFVSKVQLVALCSIFGETLSLKVISILIMCKIMYMMLARTKGTTVNSPRPNDTYMCQRIGSASFPTIACRLFNTWTSAGLRYNVPLETRGVCEMQIKLQQFSLKKMNLTMSV